MSNLKSIYNRVPRVLRGVFVNAYGLNNLRRFAKWNRILDDITFTETLDRDEQIALVDRRLKDILAYAIDNVPFYEQFAALKTDFAKRSAYDLLGEFPVTDKTFINRDPQAFLARGQSGAHISRTSGTTGTPFLIHMDKDSFLLGDALWWRRTRWAGHRPGDWIARLVGDPVIPLEEKEPEKPWMISATDRRIYLSTFHLNARTAERIGDLLNHRKPAYIMGYPSSLEILCGYLRDAGYRMGWSPKNILFSSEPMHAHQKEIISEVFPVPIRGLYGSGEKIISAAQCEAGHYHLSLVDGYLEGQFGIMEGSQPAPSTTLSNRAMPLIRYRIGDNIETQPSLVCGCGRTLPVISPVITKHEDQIITPSGRRIAPSAVVYAFIHQDIKDIKKGQVVQEDERRVTVHLKTDEATFQRYREVLRDSMNEVFFGEMDVTVVRTENIQVSQAGKSRFIINKTLQGK